MLLDRSIITTLPFRNFCFIIPNILADGENRWTFFHRNINYLNSFERFCISKRCYKPSIFIWDIFFLRLICKHIASYCKQVLHAPKWVHLEFIPSLAKCSCRSERSPVFFAFEEALVGPLITVLSEGSIHQNFATPFHIFSYVHCRHRVRRHDLKDFICACFHQIEYDNL